VDPSPGILPGTPLDASVLLKFAAWYALQLPHEHDNLIALILSMDEFARTDVLQQQRTGALRMRCYSLGHRLCACSSGAFVRALDSNTMKGWI
jgi:hypothetical protein